MNTHDEFLEAIRARPEEDGPRLLYADWLEERADPLGHFLRVQCELAAIPAADPRRPLLEPGDREMTQARTGEFLTEMRSAGVKEVRFRRGFVDRMAVTGTRFLDMWRLIATKAPLLRAVQVRNIPAREAPKALDRLMTMPCFASLRALDLSDNTLELPAIEALVEATRFGQVETLLAAKVPLGGSGLRALVSSANLGALRTLNLTRCGLSPVDGLAMSQSRGLTSLETLNLDENAIGDEGFGALVGSQTFANVKTLGVAGNGIGQPGIASFAQMSAMTGLASLNLSSNPIGDDGADLLGSSSSCARLRKLSLRDCGISREALVTLKGSTWLGRLETLES